MELEAQEKRFTYRYQFGFVWIKRATGPQCRLTKPKWWERLEYATRVSRKLRDLLISKAELALEPSDDFNDEPKTVGITCAAGAPSGTMRLIRTGRSTLLRNIVINA